MYQEGKYEPPSIEESPFDEFSHVTDSQDPDPKPEGPEAQLLSNISHLKLLQAATYVNDALHVRKHAHADDFRSLRLYALYTSSWFQTLMRVVLLIDLFLALFERPALIPVHHSIPMVIECYCLAMFMIELNLKRNFLRPGEWGRDKNNRLLLLLVMVNLLELMVYSLLQFAGLEPFRWLRVIRAFYILYFVKPIRVAFRDIAKTIPRVGNVLVLVICFVLFYTVFCWVYFFDTEQGQAWFYDPWASFCNLFVALTTANFPDVMMQTYSIQPYNSIIFLSFMVIGWGFLMNLAFATIYNEYRNYLQEDVVGEFHFERIRLWVAFNIVDQKKSGYIDKHTFIQMYTLVEPSWSSEKLELVFHLIDHDDTERIDFGKFKRISDVFHMNIRAEPTQDLKSHIFLKRFPRFLSSNFMYKLRKMVVGRPFRYGMDVIVILSAITVTVAFYIATETGEIGGKNGAQTLQETTSFAAITYLFFSLFVLEAVAKILALGTVGYFRRHWNKFDFIIIFFGFVEIAFGTLLASNQFGISFLRVFLLLRILRLFRIFAKIKSYRIIFGTMFQILPTLRVYVGVLLTTYYLFSLIGMGIWGELIYPGNHLLECTAFAGACYFANNFNDMFHSFVVCFELTVVNNWQVIVDGYVAVSSRVAWIYFIIFQLTIVIIVMNIITAFILDAFLLQYELAHATKKNPIQDRIDELDEIKRSSVHYDEEEEDGALAEDVAWIAEPKLSDNYILRQLYASELEEVEKEVDEAARNYREQRAKR